MTDVEVRPARPADVDAMVEQFAAVVDEGRWLAAEPGFDRAARAAMWRQALERPDAFGLFVAVAPDGEVVGEIVMQRQDYGVAELVMSVAASWRRRGVGSALLVAGIDWARAHRAHKVALQVWPHNTAALRLYERHGFGREGELDRHYRRSDGQLWGAVIMGLMLVEGTTAPT